MTLTATSFRPPRHFDNAADWVHDLGDIPLQRIIFDPWPGTATEADLLLLVERDKRLCELIDGTLVEKPVGLFESLIAVNLIVELGAFVKRMGLGAVFGPDGTFRLQSSGRIRLPDVSFVAQSRLPMVCTAVPVLAPDLAVEVLSEGNTKEEIDQKFKELFQSGTRLAWVIDPLTRTVAVYHGPGAPAMILTEADVLEGNAVLAGFTMPVAALFSNVPAAR
jgi:Uma2 family endonuclease